MAEIATSPAGWQRFMPDRAAARQSALYFLVVIILPTLGYAIFSKMFGFTAPIINIDLVLAYLVAVALFRLSPIASVTVATLSIALIIGVQILLGLGFIYLEDPALVIEYLSFIDLWPWKLILLWAGLGLVVLGALALLLRSLDLTRASLWPGALLLIALLGAEMADRTPLGHQLVGSNLATSSIVRMGKLVHKWMTSARFVARPLPATMMVDLAAQDPAQRILSIGVEAYGVSHSPRFDESILRPALAVLAPLYTIEVGRHAFKGATLSGEFRELCGLRTAGTPTRADALAMRPDCLPQLLHDRGFRSLAIHGNSGLFYNRSAAYPAIGFDRTLFYSDFTTRDRRAEKCVTRGFEGICDASTVRAALDFLTPDERRYAHVMSLDTHFPLGANRLGGAECPPELAGWTVDLCLYRNQMANALARMARELAAAPALPDVVFIFGDHAPPYAIAEQRNFFDRTHVPFITLRRRTSKEASTSPHPAWN